MYIPTRVPPMVRKECLISTRVPPMVRKEDSNTIHTRFTVGGISLGYSPCVSLFPDILENPAPTNVLRLRLRECQKGRNLGISGRLFTSGNNPDHRGNRAGMTNKPATESTTAQGTSKSLNPFRTVSKPPSRWRES